MEFIVLILTVFIGTSSAAIMNYNSLYDESNQRPVASLNTNEIDLRSCESRTVNNLEYEHFLDIDEMKDTRPPGYVVRFEFYVAGTKQAYVVLSTTNYTSDPAYEFGE